MEICLLMASYASVHQFITECSCLEFCVRITQLNALINYGTIVIIITKILNCHVKSQHSSLGDSTWLRGSEHSCHLSAVEGIPLVGSKCAHGPIIGESFSFLCIV